METYGGNNMNELTNPKTPFSRPLLVQLRTLLKSQDPENQTLFRGTYPFRPDQGVPPGLTSHYSQTISNHLYFLKTTH